MKRLVVAILSVFIIIFFSFCNKERIENEQVLLEEYLAENNISESDATESGLFCIASGFSTPETIFSNPPNEGDSIFTVYKGYLLSDPDVIFDEKTFDDPGEYIYQVDLVIEGWEEAMGLLKKDMSALLIIPSDLAYKGNQVGIIPPFSTLIFEVRIVDIR